MPWGRLWPSQGQDATRQLLLPFCVTDCHDESSDQIRASREVLIVGAHPNLTTAQALWDALADADPEAIRKVFSPDSVFSLCGDSPLAGRYVGTGAIMGFFAGVGDGCDDMSAELIDIPVSDHGAIIRCAVQATRGARRLETEELLLLRIVKGKIVSAVLTPLDQAEHDAFWSD